MTACRRGEVFLADLNPVRGLEHVGRRPVLVIQNDIGNRHSPVTVVAAIASSVSGRPYPTEVRLPAGAGGLERPSAVLLNQLRTIDRRRLERRVGRLQPEAMVAIDEALAISLGLAPT